MTRKRVVLLCDGSLFTGSVLRLLQGVEALDLEQVASDDPEAATAIRRFAPQVVVLDAGGPAAGRDLVGRILWELPATKVIALHLERTDMDVHRTQRVSHATLSSLLEAIQGKPPENGRRRRRGNGGEALGT